MAGIISRWWRSMGHGIHSPYAYRLVTEVLPERGRYYAYDGLERLYGRKSRRLKLLFRLVCELRPQTVCPSTLPREEKQAVLEADSGTVFVDDPAEASLTILSAPPETGELKEGQAMLSWSTGPRWAGFKRSMTRGMTFSNGHIGIAIARHGLPRQDYETRF